MTDVLRLNDGAKGVLCCPNCRSQSIHPSKVTVFEPTTKKSVEVIGIRVDENKVKFGHDIERFDLDDPHLRLAIDLTCRECGFAGELIAREGWLMDDGFVWAWRIEKRDPSVLRTEVPIDEPSL